MAGIPIHLSLLISTCILASLQQQTNQEKTWIGQARGAVINSAVLIMAQCNARLAFIVRLLPFTDTVTQFPPRYSYNISLWSYDQKNI